MSATDDRLERLIAAEVGECCDGDVEARLADLRALDRAVPADPAPDLAAMKALGTETRYRLIRLLAAAEEALCVCELTPLVDVSDSAVSHALSDLTEAGLVAREKRGTWRYYRPTARAEAVLDALDATRGAEA